MEDNQLVINTESKTFYSCLPKHAGIKLEH